MSRQSPNAVLVDLVRQGGSATLRVIGGHIPPVEQLPQLLSPAANIPLRFRTRKELEDYRRKIWNLNKNNVKYRFRTVSEGRDLIVLRLV